MDVLKEPECRSQTRCVTPLHNLRASGSMLTAYLLGGSG